MQKLAIFLMIVSSLEFFKPFKEGLRNNLSICFETAINFIRSEDQDNTVSSTNRVGYSLVREDKFDGSTLDTTLWQYYELNKFRGYATVLKSNVVVSDGSLKLLAKRSIAPDGKSGYSTSMISTMDKLNQKYGYFEIRAKVNHQPGPHCAFWLLQHSVGIVNPNPNPAVFGAEIDVFEYIPASFDNLTFGLHWNGYVFTNDSHKSAIQTIHLPGISSGFHTFALEWTPREYIVFVDGTIRARTSTAISHVPQFLILSTEIVGYGGDPVRMSSSVPDVFEVDYLKVFERIPSVNVYGGCDYSGWISADLQPGDYTTGELVRAGVIDNDASSIEIPKGWTAIAYEKDNFKGIAVSINSDTRCGGEFDNKMSSLRIFDKTVHEKKVQQ